MRLTNGRLQHRRTNCPGVSGCLLTASHSTYGIVAKAKNNVTGEDVAIKKFRQRGEEVSQSRMSHFFTQYEMVAKREIEALQTLQGHPNIIRLQQVFRHNLFIYLVFERMQQTLLEALEASNGKGLPREQVRQLVF